MTQLDDTFEIPEYGMAWLHKKVEGINRKAEKLGMRRLSIEILRKHRAPSKRKPDDQWPHLLHEWVHYLTVRFHGQSPILEGWELCGILDPLAPQRNYIRAIPGSTQVPANFASTRMECDHCGTQRKRKEVFVLFNSKTLKWKQVGRTCLRDFLGHPSPEELVELLLSILELPRTAANSAEKFRGCDRESMFEILPYLELVACVIRVSGWVSRAKATDIVAATASIATELATTAPDKSFYLKNVDRSKYEVTDTDRKKANAALEWAKTAITEEMRADVNFGTFWINLATIAEFGYFNARMDSFAAAIVASYDRAQHAKEGKATGFVGEIGKRSVFSLICSDKRPISGHERDSILHSFLDAKGHAVKWFCSGADPNIPLNTWISVKGTVKAHDNFHGEDQTLINRVKVLEAN